MRTLQVLAMCAMTSACGLPHTVLPAAAPKDAPLDQRMASYAQLAPAQQNITTSVTVVNNMVSSG